VNRLIEKHDRSLPTTGRNRTARHPPAAKRTRIVVVGGGAGGLELVTRLAGTLDRGKHDILLVDRSRTHIWKPLLHEVATGALDAGLDELAYVDHAQKHRFRFLFGALDSVDRATQQITLAPIVDEVGREVAACHRVAYDYLVLALGSQANDFGTPGVARHCMMLDSRADADRFREHLLACISRVDRAHQSVPPRRALVKIAIVGAGATGVELAAELSGVARAARAHGLDAFAESWLKVTLIEAGPRILPALDERLSKAATDELHRLGIFVRTGLRIVAADAGGFLTSDREYISADLRLWVAGVKAPGLLASIDGLETNRAGQLIVLPTLQTTHDPMIFALGDCAAFIPAGADRPVPPRAQAAHQMASIVACNLRLATHDRAMRRFVYHDHGSLVSLSRRHAIGSLAGLVGRRKLMVQGAIARTVYKSLYAKHLIAVYGAVKGLTMIALGTVNRVVRPRLKLH